MRGSFGTLYGDADSLAFRGRIPRFKFPIFQYCLQVTANCIFCHSTSITEIIALCHETRKFRNRYHIDAVSWLKNCFVLINGFASLFHPSHFIISAAKVNAKRQSPEAENHQMGGSVPLSIRGAKANTGFVACLRNEESHREAGSLRQTASAFSQGVSEASGERLPGYLSNRAEYGESVCHPTSLGRIPVSRKAHQIKRKHPLGDVFVLSDALFD